MASSAIPSPHPPPQPSAALGTGPGPGPGPGPGVNSSSSTVSTTSASSDSSTSHHVVHTPPPTSFQFQRHTLGSFLLPPPGPSSRTNKPGLAAAPGSGPSSTADPPAPATGSASGVDFPTGFAQKTLLPPNKRSSHSTANSSNSPFRPANTPFHRPTSFSFAAPPTHPPSQHDPPAETHAPVTPSRPSSSSFAHQSRPKTPSAIIDLQGSRPPANDQQQHQQPTWPPRPPTSSSNQNALQIHAPQPIHASKPPPTGFLSGFNAGHGVRPAYDHQVDPQRVKYARRDAEMHNEEGEGQYQDQGVYYRQQQQQQQQKQRRAGLALVGGMLTRMTPIPEEDGDHHHMHVCGVSSGDTGFHSSEGSAPTPTRPFTANATSSARPPSRDPSASDHIPRPAKRPRTSSGTPSSAPLDLAAGLQESIALLEAEKDHAMGRLAAAQHNLAVLQQQFEQARAAADAADRDRARERDEWAGERDAWVREREQARVDMERVIKGAEAQVAELQAQVQAGIDAQHELREQVERAGKDKERDLQELERMNADLQAENKAVLAEVEKVKAQVDVLAHVEEMIMPKFDESIAATQGVDGKITDLALVVQAGGDQAAQLAETLDQVDGQVQRVLAGVDGVVPAVTDRLVQLEHILADLAPRMQADTAAAAGALGDHVRTVHDEVLAVSRLIADQLAAEQAKCVKMQADLDAARNEKARVEVRVAELASMLDSTESRIEIVRQESQARVEELVRAREAADEQVQIERARADEAEAKAKRAEEDKASGLVELAHVSARHAEEVSEFETKVREREVRDKDLEGQLEVLQEQIKRMESDLAISQQLKDAVVDITSLLTTLDQAKGSLYAATAAESHNRLSEVEQRLSLTLEQLGSAHSEETRRLQVFFGERDAGMDDVRRRDGSAMQQQVKAIEDRLAGMHEEVANAVVTRILDKCVTQNLVFVDPNRPAAAAAPAAATAAGSMAPMPTNPAQFPSMFQSAPIPLLPPPPIHFGAGAATGAGVDDGMVIDVVSSSVDQSQSQQPIQSQDQTDEGSFILTSPTPPIPATPAAAAGAGGGVRGLRARSRVTFAMDSAVGDATQGHHPSAGNKRSLPRSPSPDIPLPMSPPQTVRRKSSAASAKSSAAANSRLVRQGIFTQRVESGDSTTTNESGSVAGSTNSLLTSPQMLTSPASGAAAGPDQHQQIQDPFAFVEGPSTSDLSSPPMADVKTEPAEPVASKHSKSALVTPIRRAKHSTTMPVESTAASGATASRPKRRVTINAPPSPAMPVEDEDEILGATRGSRSSRSAAASSSSKGKQASSALASGTRSRPGSRR